MDQVQLTGAKFLQWPHHGAKNSTSANLSLPTIWSKLSGVNSKTLLAFTKVPMPSTKNIVKIDSFIILKYIYRD